MKSYYDIQNWFEKVCISRAETDRLNEDGWSQWGPYLAERQWGTVREDESHDGNWSVTPSSMILLVNKIKALNY